MMVIVNRRLSIIDFRMHQISRSLGCVSPTPFCGGGGLSNRNAPFKGEPSSSTSKRRGKSDSFASLTTTCSGSLCWRLNPSRRSFFSFLKLITYILTTCALI